jgi:hypothetical protein
MVSSAPLASQPICRFAGTGFRVEFAKLFNGEPSPNRLDLTYNWSIDEAERFVRDGMSFSGQNVPSVSE